MDNSSEMMSLCRLCLVKDQVNVPIFEEQGDVRQIFFKISSCLPVKVSRDDKLPKKICDGCLYKLDMLYEFWKTSANAEKTLLSWLGQAGVKGTDVHQTLSAVAQEITNKPNDSGGGAFVKEEPNDAAAHQTQEVDPNFMLQNFQQKWGEDNAAAGSSASAAAASSATVEEPPRKRARRTAAVKAQINLTPETDEDDDDDMDNVEPITKVEDESDESDGDDRDDGQFGDVSGTNNDDQPGPSGVGKDGGEIPLSYGYQCPKCSKFFITQLGAALHEKHCASVEPSDPKPRKCSLCDKVFTLTAAPLQRYNRPDICDECFKSDRNKLISTLLNKSKCSYCPIEFDTQSERAKHEVRHTKNLRFICDQCGKGFALNSQLKRHHETHFEPKYECHFCFKKFTVHTTMVTHMQVHDEKRTMRKCPHCPKQYLNNSRYNKHLREHKVGKKTFKCHLCTKLLCTKSSLRNHIRIVHAKEKEFECYNCSQQFATKVQLKLHSYQHTNERPFPCELCDRAFILRGQLKAHVLKKH